MIRNWRGDKHGPWRRNAGGLNVYRAPKLPVRFNSGPTPRDAVMDLVRLIAEEPGAWGMMP